MSEDNKNPMNEKAIDAMYKQLMRSMNPSWGTLIWSILLQLTRITVTYIVIGAALRFGWKLVG